MKSIYIRRIDIGVTFLIGMLFIVTTLCEYHVKFNHMYELTFLSNFITGGFMLFSDVLKCIGRKIPQVIYLDFTILLMIVFGVTTLFSAHFTLRGAMLYLHAVNPIVLLVYYFIFSNQTGTNIKAVFTTLIMPLVYLIFAVIFGNVTGKYIYFFLNYKWYGMEYTLSFICGIAVGTVALSFILWILNRILHRLTGPKASKQ